MFVEKNGKIYEVTERKEFWSVILKGDGVTVDFQIDKKLCETEEDVEKYIKREGMF